MKAKLNILAWFLGYMLTYQSSTHTWLWRPLPLNSFLSGPSLGSTPSNHQQVASASRIRKIIETRDTIIDIPVTYARGRGATIGVNRGRGVWRGRGRISGRGNLLGPDRLSFTGESLISRIRESLSGIGKNYSRPRNQKTNQNTLACLSQPSTLQPTQNVATQGPN